MAPWQTERLELRPWTPSAVISALMGPLALGRALGVAVDPGWPNPDFGGALPGLAESLVELGGHGVAGLLVLRGPAPQVVGELGLKGPPDERGAVELGYGIVPAHRGRGLATEAVRGFCGWLMRETRLDRITAEVEAGNAASRRVLEKAGFRARPGPGPNLWFELPRR